MLKKKILNRTQSWKENNKDLLKPQRDLTKDKIISLSNYIDKIEFEDKELSIGDHKSLYYYQGRNVFKHIGKFILKIDYHFFNLPDDKNNELIEENKEKSKLYYEQMQEEDSKKDPSS